MIKASLIASLTMPRSDDGAEVRALPDSVKCLEVRADLVGEVSTKWLRTRRIGLLPEPLTEPQFPLTERTPAREVVEPPNESKSPETFFG